MEPIDPDWVAPRAGHDWLDPDVLRATEWLRSFVAPSEMDRRLASARAELLEARAAWGTGTARRLYDPTDAAAWYVLQSETFAAGREFWVPDEMVRIVPYVTRLGKELDRLRSIPGVDDRAARLMTSERSQPDAGLFELLVALAYRRHGWDVAFVPERPGVGKTHDLDAERAGDRWAVECKRLVPSTFANGERVRADVLASPVHALSLDRYRPLVVEVTFSTPLADLDDEHLVRCVSRSLDEGTGSWVDPGSCGLVRDVDWTLLRRVLRHDYVFHGSSRMIELLKGSYDHDWRHSLSAKWRRAPGRPFFADAVYHASVVTWRSASPEAMRRKAGHFRRVVGKAEAQLPHDRPGVIHVGIEGGTGGDVDGHRHLANLAEARRFRTTTSQLRWVYGNHFVPEVTTRRDETWALTETTVPYRIGSHDVPWPLSGHALVTPEPGMRDGMHWDGRAP